MTTADVDYDVLHELMPRYIRVMRIPNIITDKFAGGASNKKVFHEEIKSAETVGAHGHVDIDAAIKSLESLYNAGNQSWRKEWETLYGENINVRDMIFKVRWLPDFIAIPGCLPLPDGGISGLIAKGLFPMDAASAVAVYALRLPLYQGNVSDPLQSEMIPCGSAIKRDPSQASALKILDLCCCPGAKFMHLADLPLPSGSVVVGVDINRPRITVCKSLLRYVRTYVVCYLYIT